MISTSGFGGRHFQFRMSSDVGPCRHSISVSGVVENVGVAVEIASPSLSKAVFTSSFVADGQSRFEFLM